MIKNMETLIKQYNEDNKALNMISVQDSDKETISTENCKLLWLHVALDPNSSQYGYILGGFLYIPTDQVFAFRYHIHRPNQKYASLSNRMMTIEEMFEKTESINGDEYIFFERHQVGFGQRAFWINTPDDILKTNEEKDLRKLIRNITAYSRKMDFCKKLRKIDKKHVEWLQSIYNN